MVTATLKGAAGVLELQGAADILELEVAAGVLERAEAARRRGGGGPPSLAVLPVPCCSYEPVVVEALRAAAGAHS